MIQINNKNGKKLFYPGFSKSHHNFFPKLIIPKKSTPYLNNQQNIQNEIGKTKELNVNKQIITKKEIKPAINTFDSEIINNEIFEKELKVLDKNRKNLMQNLNNKPLKNIENIKVYLK